MKKNLALVLALLLLCCAASGFAFTYDTQTISVNGITAELQVPVDMQVEFVASLDNPRFITIGPDKEMIIGSRGAALYRLLYPYKDVETLVMLNGYLHSAAYLQGRLYAAETQAVWSAPYTGASTVLAPGDFSAFVSLPSATGGHSSRTIVTGPDNRLYVGLGISGNCADEYLQNSYPFERRRGGVFALDGAGTLTPFSSGLRNPIGLAFHPQTGTLFATNAGPDNLGYDRPPEILTQLAENSFHGMPWYQYYDGGFKSGECATSQSPRPVTDAVVPIAFFPARSTPQGLVFLVNSTLGSRYNGSAVVAIHGSWATQPGQGNASRRPPQLSFVDFSQAKPYPVADLISGFQRADGSRFARPSGVAVGGDGHIYFTSDGGDVVGLFRLVPRSQSSKGRAISSLGLLLDDQ